MIYEDLLIATLTGKKEWMMESPEIFLDHNVGKGLEVEHETHGDILLQSQAVRGIIT
jgi:hypothetical protein